MKTAVGVVATMMMTAMVATEASAEWRLYVNRDNKAWTLDRVFVSNDECDRAARSLYKSGQALGVGCAEYPAQAQAQAPAAARGGEVTRPTHTPARQVARADEPTRVSTSRPAARAAEYPSRPTPPRRAAAVEAPAASQSHPAAVIFLPSGGIELRSEDAPKPTPVATQPTPEARRQPAPAAQRAPEEDKNSPAVALAKAASEGTAASVREAEAETAKREAEVTVSKAERRTHLAVFGGVVLVLGTGIGYSVSRVARASRLRGLAVCLIEVGLLTAALAYPVVEMWTKLKLTSSIVPSTMPGVLGGLLVGGVGLIAFVVERVRKPSAKPVVLPAPGTMEPAKPVEPVKPVDQAKPIEPAKPAEPVRPPQPIRLEPTSFLEAPRPEAPAEAPKRPIWAKPPEQTKQPEAATQPEVAKPADASKAPEPVKPPDSPASAAGGS
jgi:hypothetical protein